MADGTPIEWTDATWNPIVGCSVVSPGCTNCYAMRLAGTRMRSHPSRAGLTQDSKAGPVWTGEVRFQEQWLTQPLRWQKPRMIFVCAHADLFHESVPDELIDRVFAVMALSPQHTFQVLTKRPERMREYLRDEDRLGGALCMAVFGITKRDPGPAPQWPLPNVWLGVSVEDQRRADERIPILLDTPAAVRWASAEPLLGPIDLTRISFRRYEELFEINCFSDEAWVSHPPDQGLEPGERFHRGPALGASVNWVVAGGESGPGARPMHPDWARSLRDQCAAADVPFLFKQWGEWAEGSDFSADAKVVTADGRIVDFNDRALADADRAERVVAPTLMRRVGKKAAGRRLDGVIHDAWPEARP